MIKTQTEANFAQLSWHDCHIYRMEIAMGNPDEGDWTSDLIFGLDFIVEWLCRDDGKFQFKIAPAELTFHGVTVPKVGIDFGTDGFFQMLQIEQLVREPVQNQKVYLDRPYYCWRLKLNLPHKTELTFGAVGFTQILLSEPMLCDRQYLTLKERRRLLGH